MRIVSILTLLLSLFVSHVVAADIYRCQDAAGRWLFTDSISQCPGQRTSVRARQQPQRVSHQYISQIPDLLQTHPLADFLKGGRNYCAPVAVANSLSWLAGKKSVDNQIHLAGRLANKRYMNSAENGTTPAALLAGVQKYFTDNQQRPTKLAFQGWRSVPAQYRRGSGSKIDLNWLADGITDTSTVWLNVGWYQKTANPSEFKRVGGHWVTLVGYELNNPTGVKNRLIVHDPAPRSGDQFANEFVDLLPLPSGYLVNHKQKKKQHLGGQFRLSGGMHVSERADFALLDGAVRLDM